MVGERWYFAKQFLRNVRLRPPNPWGTRIWSSPYFLFSQARPSASVSQKLTWLLRLQVKITSRMED